MKKLLAGAAVALGLATPAVAQSNYAYTFPQTGHVVYVSCFRGPWKEVIWDRPNAKFVDSLRDLGYDYPNAHAIAERVCRDDALVFNKEGLKQEMIRIYYGSKAYREKGAPNYILR
ncbi:hypothetical protein [Maritimibacter alkaliphilus]|uniref:hypothetical protein n=1 Tax=Maritimibacter alkaliphilus TaxID=404236 RepID=UPI001C96FB97|nr:hypothetical protein [Maritimibacter alkaliphilus]MBY6091405.1 hypothetical protein [Maritimibacter alkaliphilus]